MAQEPHANREEVSSAEHEIRTIFVRDYEDLLRGRTNLRPQASDDQAVFGLADRAVHEYLRAMATNPALARLSRVQLMEIRRSLYVSHSALGPLGPLLAIEGVEDIHIHGTQGGYLEYGDHREPLPVHYESEEELIQLLRWYAELSGKHFDPGNPLLTFTLRDGSRFNAILPPVAKPLVVTIRRQQPRRFLSPDDLIRERAMPISVKSLLHAAVLARLNVVVSGSTGSGKTTVVRTLALQAPEGERTCVLETETELWLHDLRDDFFSLEEREANVEGAGEITMQQLFQRGALRQRPRRIIVGEVRGKEALDMLHAMTSGHDGSLTTVHASGPRLALNRLQMLAMSADENLSPLVVSQMVGTGVDMVIHLGMYQRGSRLLRRMTHLCFVDHNVEDPSIGPIVQEICRYRVAEDDWEWETDALRFMPRKIRDKFEAAGIDDRPLRFEVMDGDGR
jgi:pilus assembly protein CpaF